MAKDHYQELRSVFNRAALEREGYYDSECKLVFARHTIWQHLNRFYILSILRRFKQKKELHTCLDAGCGMGDFSHLLGKRLPYKKVHGIDFSEEMIGLARKKYDVQRNPWLSFSKEDLSKRLSFQDASYDLSVCLNVLHQFLPEDQKSLIAELCRVSKDLVILEIKRYHFIPRLLTGYRA